MIGMEMSSLPGVNMSCQTLLLHLRMEKRKGLQMKLFILFLSSMSRAQMRDRICFLQQCVARGRTDMNQDIQHIAGFAAGTLTGSHRHN